MDIDQIKAELKESTRQVLDALGIIKDTRNGRYYCPLCQPEPSKHKDGDMWVRGSHIKCHRCGVSTDIIGIYMQTRNVGFIEAIEAMSNRKFKKAVQLQRVRMEPKKKPKKVYESVQLAIDEIEKHLEGWRWVEEYVYRDAEGTPVMYVIRYEKDGEKTFRPISWEGKGWVIGKADGLTTIYNLPAVMTSFDETVIAVEGEKACDALNGIGLLATTSAGGANAVDKTDWTPLKRRKVLIWPDNDEAGMVYAKAVQKHLPQSIIFQPKMTKEKDDAYDWIKEREGKSNQELIEELRKEWINASK